MTSPFWKDFLIGAPVSILPIIYIGTAVNTMSPGERAVFPLSTLILVLPFIYGLMYALIQEHIGRPYLGSVPRVYAFIIMGMIAGGLYSLMGHYGGLDIPTRVFKMANPATVHLLAPVIYGIVYGLYSFMV